MNTDKTPYLNKNNARMLQKYLRRTRNAHTIVCFIASPNGASSPVHVV